MVSNPPGHTVVGQPAGCAAHAARPTMPAARLLVFGAAAVVLLSGVGVGLAACVRGAGSSPSAPRTAQLITVTPSADSPHR